MPDPHFDPARAVIFDLVHGLVHLDGAPSRLLVPAVELAALARAAGPEATAAFGRSMGQAMGRRVANRLSSTGGVTASAVEVVVEHLSGELSLAGLGSLSLERWGRALALVVDQSPLGAEGDGLLAAVLAGAVEAAAGRSVHVLLLARDEVRARLLIAGAPGVDEARASLAAGVSWGDALVRLHAVHDRVDELAGWELLAEPVEESPPVSARQPLDKERPVDVDDEDDAPVSGEVSSQRKPAQYAEPRSEGDPAAFLGAPRVERPASFGELLDAALALGA